MTTTSLKALYRLDLDENENWKLSKELKANQELNGLFLYSSKYFLLYSKHEIKTNEIQRGNRLLDRFDTSFMYFNLVLLSKIWILELINSKMKCFDRNISILFYSFQIKQNRFCPTRLIKLSFILQLVNGLVEPHYFQGKQ